MFPLTSKQSESPVGKFQGTIPFIPVELKYEVRGVHGEQAQQWLNVRTFLRLTSCPGPEPKHHSCIFPYPRGCDPYLPHASPELQLGTAGDDWGQQLSLMLRMVKGFGPEKDSIAIRSFLLDKQPLTCLPCIEGQRPRRGDDMLGPMGPSKSGSLLQTNMPQLSRSSLIIITILHGSNSMSKAMPVERLVLQVFWSSDWSCKQPCSSEQVLV